MTEEIAFLGKTATEAQKAATEWLAKQTGIELVKALLLGRTPMTLWRVQRKLAG
jgi:hypothetical protein